MDIQNMSTLDIHKLSRDQYDRIVQDGTIDENAIYIITPEKKIDLSGYATIEQLNGKANITDMTDLQTKVGTKPVNEQITNAIEANGMGILSVYDIQDMGTVTSNGSIPGQWSKKIFNFSDGTSTEIKIDSTLSEQWVAADAKTVGDAIGSINNTIQSINTTVSSINTALDEKQPKGNYASESDVVDLQTKVGNKSVSEQISTALEGLNDPSTLNIKTYNTLTQLGLSGAVTISQVSQILPDYSIFLFSNSTTGATDYISDAPSTYCNLEFYKTSARCTVKASTTGTYIPKFYEGTWHIQTGWSGWRKLMSSILTTEEYGNTLPDPGTPGRIFFLKAD